MWNLIGLLGTSETLQVPLVPELMTSIDTGSPPLRQGTTFFYQSSPPQTSFENSRHFQCFTSSIVSPLQQNFLCSTNTLLQDNISKTHTLIITNIYFTRKMQTPNKEKQRLLSTSKNTSYTDPVSGIFAFIHSSSCASINVVHKFIWLFFPSEIL